MTTQLKPLAPLDKLEAEGCKRSFHFFFQTFWPVLYQGTPLEENWHIKYLCDELQLMGEDVIAGREFVHNAIINISPGETKSTICTVLFPAWLWCRAPHLRIITASYEESLAIGHSTFSRDVISSDKYRRLFPHVELRKDMAAKKVYGNTAGGQRITSSVGGAVTGKHAHIIIVDDPLDVRRANSEVELETANNWMQRTLPSRKVDLKTAPTVLIMQRLNEMDCTATMSKIWEKQGKLKHIVLPADDRYQIQPAALKKHYTKDGDLRVMNPARRGTKVLRDLEAISLQMYAGQFGQNPAPAEGNKLKKGWFEQRISLAKLQQLAEDTGEPLRICATVDGAYTKEKKNSATGVLVWAILNSKLYLIDYAEYWLEFPELCDTLPDFVRAAGVGFEGLVYVEPKGPGKSLVQMLSTTGGLNIIEDELPQGVTRQAGKELRVDGIANFVRGGGVVLVEGADWEPFIQTLAVFPAGAHDDLVDCFVMACEKVQGQYNVDAWEAYLAK